MESSKEGVKARIGAFAGTNHADRVTISEPKDLNQVLQILQSPEQNGIINLLSKSVSEALDYSQRKSGGGFSPFEMLNVFVEILNDKDPAKAKVLKQSYEYRRPVPGLEAEQLKDLLSKLPAMTQKRPIAKQLERGAKAVRFGFGYGLAHEFETPKTVVLSTDNTSERSERAAATDSSSELPAEYVAVARETVNETALESPKEQCVVCSVYDSGACTLHREG